jgi:predicted dehydrogenase
MLPDNRQHARTFTLFVFWRTDDTFVARQAATSEHIDPVLLITQGTFMNIGLIGCGSASQLYLEGCKQFNILHVTGCADLVEDKARARASEFNIPGVCGVEDLLSDSRVDTILNLTEPQAHAEIGMAALESGKNLYQEKPLAVELEDARLMLEIAEKRGLRIGCAPDSFMGGGLQTCRQLIDEGAIGEPVACTAFMMCHGHEDWHANPEFFYMRGGGPMFDMGPYYLTAMISLFGPIRRVTASAKVTSNERAIIHQARYGQKIKVEVSTHVAGIIDFVSGVVGTIITSFDVWASELPSIEVYGTEGTLSVPDPETYRGPVRLFSARLPHWVEVPMSREFTGQSRGIGLAEMAYAIRRGHAHRANGEMAYHVLDVMHCFHDASLEGRHIELTSTCSRPQPLPENLNKGYFG